MHMHVRAAVQSIITCNVYGIYFICKQTICREKAATLLYGTCTCMYFLLSLINVVMAMKITIKFFLNM